VRKQPRRKHIPLINITRHVKNEQKQLKLQVIIRFLGGFGNNEHEQLPICSKLLDKAYKNTLLYA
jgi:hypothetical protein